MATRVIWNANTWGGSWQWSWAASWGLFVRKLEDSLDTGGYESRMSRRIKEKRRKAATLLALGFL